MRPGQGVTGELEVREVQRHEQGIVVEHLFEVGHQPLAVHGVAVEAAPHLVVDAAPGHLVEAQPHHRQALPVAGEAALGQEKSQLQGPGEFRGAAKAAMLRSKLSLRSAAAWPISGGVNSPPWPPMAAIMCRRDSTSWPIFTTVSRFWW